MSTRAVSSTFKICPDLQDRDFHALGCTSKKMYDIAKREIEERDIEQARLLSLYTVTRKFNIFSLKEIDLFCLGERHNYVDCMEAEIAFVAFLVLRGPVILISEGWPSMKVLEGKNWWVLAEIQASINPAFAGSLYSVGWDDQEKLRQLQEDIKKEYITKRSALNNDRQKLLDRAIKILPSELIPSQEETSMLKPTCSKFYRVFMEKIETKGIACNSIEVLEKVAIISEEHTKMEKIYHTLRNERSRKKNAALEETFPIRTKSNVNTLQQLKKLKSDLGIPNAKAVSISGIAHLETDSEEQGKPEFDLKTFYQELSNHRAAIFIPLEVEASAKALLEARRQLSEAKSEALRIDLEAKLQASEARQQALRADIEAEKRALLGQT